MEPDDKERLEQLRTLIADGHQPPCPFCNSELTIETSEGSSGSRAFSYACSSQTCGLKPGIAMWRVASSSRRGSNSWAMGVGSWCRRVATRSVSAPAG